ncbi:hypothetical protein R1sor_010960 [Riccia sorocarpa]|uniref:Telomere length regulation protein conserved domain-containing protein n=1 Tax=Riccia sorocarpa TaxID=122646 RepID=A0ABD3I2Y7_9MARC
MERVEDAIQELLKAVLQSIHEAVDVHVVTDALSVVASLLWSSTADENSGKLPFNLDFTFDLDLRRRYKLVISAACYSCISYLPTARGFLVSGFPHSDASVTKSLAEVAALCVERATAAQPEMPWREILNRVFFFGQAFSILAQFLLKEIAVHWLACFSLAEQKSLFDDFFTRAPPSEALLELVPALSQGYAGPESDKADEDDGLEASVGDDVQAVIRFQAQRLLVLILVTKKGVRELALSLSSSVKLPGASPRFEGRFASVSTSSTETAQLLSSIPDRASFHSPLALQSPDYFQDLTEQVLAAAEEKWNSYALSNGTKVPVEDPTFKFAGEVLAKLCRRGYAGVVATQMLPLLMQYVTITSVEDGNGSQSSEISDIKLEQLLERLQCSFWPSLAAAFHDSYALDRLTEVLLKEMATRRDLTDWEAYCILQAFYGKLFHVQVAARALFTEKLLLTKILPVRCLRWILGVAVLCSPPNPSPQSRPMGNRIQKDVVKHLVEAWAAKEFVQSKPVQQQAYVTAAVGLCLESMKKDDFQDIGGFVQYLLKGISNRLDSPLVQVRQMGKRIALAFSLAMDSEKPLLLDEEDTREDLQNWEGLEEMVRGNVKSEAPRIDIKEALDTDSSINSGEATGGRLEVGNDETRKLEERRRRREKKERLALEEDDPDAVVRLEEGFSFEESDVGSESESESDSDLVPYDMPEESESTSKVKAPTQLYDCAAYLRKEDDSDMVEKALEVVGRLVMEMPEELDQHAADLAHALLHVRCTSVEGEEAVAEKRQRDALVALLACSPVNTVTALTSELFSSHIDVSQRLLILEVMAAGARAISNGLYRKKVLDERRNVQLITDMTGLESGSWRGPSSSAGPPGAGPWKEVSSPLLGDRLVGWGTSYERELPLAENAQVAGRSRKWGLRSMELREEGRKQGLTDPQDNAFAALAPMFMLPVMKEYDVKRHGVDLLGRDYLVLGSMLSMLAECMKCIALQPEAALLGAALLDLLRSRQISLHNEPFVRRAALYGASCVMGALHPTDVVSSLFGGVGNMANNLEWVREWALDVANNDSDQECSMVAMACLQLHSEMAMLAMRSMGSSAAAEDTWESKVQSATSSAPVIMPFQSSSHRIILEP